MTGPNRRRGLTMGVSTAVFALATALAAQAPEKKVYKEWTVDELVPSVKDLGVGRNWEQGREYFRKTGA